MAILKEIRENELYLYMNGHLIYKRWLDTGHSKVFDVIAYDKYTYSSITDLDLEKTPPLIHVQANLKLKKTQDSGRKNGIFSGYRPNHVFEYQDGQLLRTFIGDIQFDGQLIEPGQEREVTVRFLTSQPIEKYLNIGRTWWIHEGASVIGEAEIKKIELPTTL